MTRLDTDALIDRLAGEASPVRRVDPVWKRVALWFAFGIPPLLVIVAVHGLAIDATTLLADRQLLIEQVAALLTAVTAAAAAFASTIPGVNRRWLWLPALPLAVWLLALGKGCLDDWLRLGPEGLALRPDFECLGPMLLIGSRAGSGDAPHAPPRRAARSARDTLPRRSRHRGGGRLRPPLLPHR